MLLTVAFFFGDWITNSLRRLAAVEPREADRNRNRLFGTTCKGPGLAFRGKMPRSALSR